MFIHQDLPFALSEAVAFVQEVLQEILNSIQDKNVAELLRQAEIILQEIRARDFKDAKSGSMEELEKAMQGGLKSMNMLCATSAI